MIRFIRVGILIALGTTMVGVPTSADGGPTLANAIETMRIACERAPSVVCTNRAAALFDDNGDGGIDRSEFDNGRRQMVAEARKKQSVLTVEEIGTVAIAAAVLDNVGVDEIFNGFDENKDNRIDRAEMFADFRLDARPFGELVTDPEAVDWQSFANRFGRTGQLFLPVLKGAKQ